MNICDRWSGREIVPAVVVFCGFTSIHYNFNPHLPIEYGTLRIRNNNFFLDRQYLLTIHAHVFHSRRNNFTRYYDSLDDIFIFFLQVYLIVVWLLRAAVKSPTFGLYLLDRHHFGIGTVRPLPET